MPRLPFLAALGLAAALALPPRAHAGPGHDHGHDYGGAPAATGPALPRFAAVSDAFELVGVLEGQTLTLYLDRAADNAPVTGATIELDVGGVPLKATPREDAYAVVLAAAPPPGVLPITATVTAGAEVDLLAGDLAVPAATDDTAHGHAHAPAWVLWGGAVVAALGAVAALIVARRRPSAGDLHRTGAAA